MTRVTYFVVCFWGRGRSTGHISPRVGWRSLPGGWPDLELDCSQCPPGRSRGWVGPSVPRVGLEVGDLRHSFIGTGRNLGPGSLVPGRSRRGWVGPSVPPGWAPCSEHRGSGIGVKVHCDVIFILELAQNTRVITTSEAFQKVEFQNFLQQR